MKPIIPLLCAALLGLYLPPAQAAVTVDSLNYPVWVERGSNNLPLAPGDSLRAGDVVQTGATGRVWLEVDDGSVIKLGQDARFAIEQAAFSEESGATVLDAAFDVLKGAFRFTSKFFQPKRRAVHRLDFTVGAVTAGIRGTDIWGLSSDAEDFVALLEGRIEVSSAGQAPQLLEQPLSLYRKADGQPADPVTLVDMATVEALAPQTELDPSAGVADTIGNYGLVLQSLSDPGNVDAALQRYRSDGYAVRARNVEVNWLTVTRIQLEGLVHLESANNLRRAMIEAGVIDDAWVNPIR